MKIMRNIFCGLCSHRISSRPSSYEGFWTDVSDDALWPPSGKYTKWGKTFWEDRVHPSGRKMTEIMFQGFVAAPTLYTDIFKPLFFSSPFSSLSLICICVRIAVLTVTCSLCRVVPGATSVESGMICKCTCKCSRLISQGFTRVWFWTWFLNRAAVSVSLVSGSCISVWFLIYCRQIQAVLSFLFYSIHLVKHLHSCTNMSEKKNYQRKKNQEF